MPSKDPVKRSIYFRNYYNNHRDVMNERNKNYQQSSEKWLNYVKEKMTCECGTVINRKSKYAHLKSNKHSTQLGLLDLKPIDVT